jgi:LuxR family transcriptional regulator, maltose regulon positive regulatory protein
MSVEPVDNRRRVPGTKLAVPKPPSRLVTRPRLLATLDLGRQSLVTLVSAPAGAGKTLLLAEWVRERGGPDTAWVSLDSDDNDDGRFWSALLEALFTTAAVPRDGPLANLAVPANPSADPRFLSVVVDALDNLPRPVVLVLDDVQELTDARPLQGLEALLRHRPAGLRLVLSSRRDPQLSLARLRLADQLTELGAEELRFSTGEVRALLETEGIELDHEQLDHLLEKTEGWAAALRLAMLSQPRTSDPNRFLANFAANDRGVAEYLIDEVLSQLPADMADFIRTVSICEHTTVDLATALSGRIDAGALLDAIAQRTSLIFRVDSDPRRYHVHALLRSQLLADLLRQEPDRAALLHGTAADWHAAHDQPASALAHATKAADTARTTALLHRSAVALVLDGDHDLVRDALDTLGARSVVEDPLLALVSALVHVEQGDPTGADRDLADAEAAWPAEPGADLASLRLLVRARYARFVGDDALNQVTGDIAATPGLFAAPAMLQRGGALLAAGELTAAREQLRAALQVARDGGHGYVAVQCMTMLSGVAAVEGDYGLMVALAAAADEENARRGWVRTVEATTASLMLGYGALLRADPTECLRQTQRASWLVDQDDPPAMRGLVLAVETLRGAAEFELGDRIAGARRVNAARRAGGRTHFAAEQIALNAVLGNRAALQLGWTSAAGDTLRWAQDGIPDSAEVHLMRSRTQLATGRRAAATKIIQPVLDEAAPPVLRWSMIEAWLLATEIALSAGDTASALRSLKRGLSIAQHLDVSYPLVFAVPEVTDLLTSRLGKLGTAEAFAERVFALRRTLHVTSMAPLTARERTVLNMLPTLRSLDEIAEDLTVSANTVKTHVRAIYAKLGVTRRRDAVAVALERGLLENAPGGDS